MGDLRLGIIGFGNMAGAILKSALNNSVFSLSVVTVFDTDPQKMQYARDIGVNTAATAGEAVINSDIILLSVKPQVIEPVLSEIRNVSDGKCVVSIAAGISADYIKSRLSPKAYVLRVMPNTPIMIGKGATAIAKSDDVPYEYYKKAVSIFSGSGEVAFIDEERMNEIISVNSSSPAYFFLLVDAMVKCAEEQGIDKAVALRLSAKAMEGAASMLLESGKSPEELASQVTSPGGTTFAALKTLEDNRFQDTVRKAMKSCTKRAYELGK